MGKISQILSKIDFRLSPHAYSRPQYQTQLIINKLSKLKKGKYTSLLDVGGGSHPQYKTLLTSITCTYTNLDIEKGVEVDIVGTIYNIPLSDNSQDIITLFMVLEHLNNPLKGLIECHRVLKKGGYIGLTTVQYWHTHGHPDDYFRYTKKGLENLCNNAGLKIINIWSQGGPILVMFHVVELNLGGLARTLYSILFYNIANLLDWMIFKHNDRRENSDSLGWSLIAIKK